MKFANGAMVKIRLWEDMAAEYNSNENEIETGTAVFTRRMKPLCGKKAIVEEIEGDKFYKLRPVQIEDMLFDWDWRFTDEMLEQVKVNE